jgi:aromatic-L-amino-acid/L-tryptophan decarboxylase
MPPLRVSADEFRAIADGVNRLVADFLSDLEERRTVSATSTTDTAAFDLPLPEEGVGEAALRDLEAISEHLRAPTGRRLPYVLGSGDPIGALGDLYASVLNQNVTAWRSAPAAVTIERTVVGWLAAAIGCNGFVGTFTSGGSLGNLMALAMARESRAPANEDGVRSGMVVYASEEIHMSIPKAVAMLGLGRTSLRVIPVDEKMRIQVPALETAIARDREAGRRGIALVGSAGTIMSGAIDPLAELADVARRNELWFHVDGAYGAAAALAQPEKFVGMSRADSISLDAHKWLYQPLDCSVLLYRDEDAARHAFAYSAEYVKTASDDPIAGFAFFDQTIELSRRFRALKLWLSLRYHGLEPSLELLAPVELSAVCFRWANAETDTLNDLNEEILREVNQAGRVWLSNASIRGAVGLRACITNHRTTEQDVRTVVEEVLAAADRVTAPA